MKYVSLDIETTGLNKKECQVIQIGAVIDDFVTPIDQLPRFQAFIKHDILKFEPYALELHRKTGLLARYLADKEMQGINLVIIRLQEFLMQHYPLVTHKDKWIMGGKNLANFDLPFLREASGLAADLLANCSHRVIDPATFFTDLENDKAPVNLEDCKKRAGIENTVVTHDALDDALDIVKVVRYIANSNRGRFIPTPYQTNT